MTVSNHLLDVGATSACLALAYVHKHLLDTDLILTVSEGFADVRMTTEELHELAYSYMLVVRSLLWSGRFNPLPYVFGSRVY